MIPFNQPPKCRSGLHKMANSIKERKQSTRGNFRNVSEKSRQPRVTVSECSGELVALLPVSLWVLEVRTPRFCFLSVAGVTDPGRSAAGKVIREPLPQTGSFRSLWDLISSHLEPHQQGKDVRC